MSQYQSFSVAENGYDSFIRFYEEHDSDYELESQTNDNYVNEEECPVVLRVSRKTSSNVKSTSTGIRITMPVFSVKVSPGSSRPAGMVTINHNIFHLSSAVRI